LGFSTDYRKWRGGVCKINLTGPGWDPAWVPSARSAMKMWNAATAKFKFMEDASSAANIHLAAYKFRSQGWIGFTQLRPSKPGSYLTGRDVLINLWYEFNPPHSTETAGDTAGPYQLETILAHEFGHLLHLNEDLSGSATMMRPVIKPGQSRKLHNDDIAGIKTLYP